MTLLVGTEKAKFQIYVDVESANKPYNTITCALHQNAEFSDAVLHWRGDFERVFKKSNTKIHQCIWDSTSVHKYILWACGDFLSI